MSNTGRLDLRVAFERNLNKVKNNFKNFNKYIIPSLIIRAKRGDWLLNVIIREIIRNNISYLDILESLFDRAKPETINNFGAIFAEIAGDSEEYDERLEDAMAEVSACSFLRFQKHNGIEKLTGTGKPDFISSDRGNMYLTEAKSLREPDKSLNMIFHVFEAAKIYDKELQEYNFSLCPTPKYVEEKEKNKGNKNKRLNFEQQCKTIIKNNLVRDIKALLEKGKLDRGQKICDGLLAIFYINKSNGGIAFRPRPIENGLFLLDGEFREEKLRNFKNKLDRVVKYAAEEQILKYDQHRIFKGYFVFLSWAQPGEFMFIDEEIIEEFFEQTAKEYCEKYNNKVFLARKTGNTYKKYPG